MTSPIVNVVLKNKRGKTGREGIQGSSINGNLVSRLLFRICGSKWSITHVSTTLIRDICWSPELKMFVAVSSGNGNRIIYSYDGINWTEIVSTAWGLLKIVWCPELSIFCAIGNNGAIITSDDGLIWSQRSSNNTNSIRSVCWAPKLNSFYAVSSTGTNDRLLVSSNGIDWLAQNMPFENSWTDICWSDSLEKLVAVSSDGTGNRICYSEDGITWTTSNTPLDSAWNYIIWVEKLQLFIVSSPSGAIDARLMTSADGITWVNKTVPSGQLRDIIWIDELEVAACVLTSGTARLIYSYDGITWYQNRKAPIKNWATISWSPELGVIVLGSNDSVDTDKISTSRTLWA